MNHQIQIDGQFHTLTTDHAASSNGQPVLVRDEDRQALGTADTCRLHVDSATDDGLAALTAAGYEFDDCR